MGKKKSSSLKLKDVAKNAKDTGAGSYHKDIDTLKKSISGKRAKRFNVNIPESLHRKLRIKVAKEGTTLSELAIRLFKEYLSK